MDIISLGARSGKTTYLVLRSSINKVPLLAKNEDQKLQFLWLAREMNITIPKPVLISELKAKDGEKPARKPKEVMIDDVEDMLNYLLKTKVSAVTHLTGERKTK